MIVEVSKIEKIESGLLKNIEFIINEFESKRSHYLDTYTRLIDLDNTIFVFRMADLSFELTYLLDGLSDYIKSLKTLILENKSFDGMPVYQKYSSEVMSALDDLSIELMSEDKMFLGEIMNYLIKEHNISLSFNEIIFYLHLHKDIKYYDEHHYAVYFPS